LRAKTGYSVSRLNEPKVSEAKYKFDWSAKFILQPDWSAKFILQPDWSAKFILRQDCFRSKFILRPD